MGKFVFTTRVKTKSFLHDFFAMLKNITGGRIKPYEDLMKSCIQEAHDELTKKYGKLKNIRLMTTELTKGASEIIMYGEVDDGTDWICYGCYELYGRE